METLLLRTLEQAGEQLGEVVLLGQELEMSAEEPI